MEIETHDLSIEPFCSTVPTIPKSIVVLLHFPRRINIQIYATVEEGVAVCQLFGVEK